MGKKTYFISDLHLGASYISDPRAHERHITDFLKSIEHDAEALYLLGDVMDYWYEYRNVAPRGFTRFLGALASLADAGVEIYWFKGNHDIWLFDYLSSEIGLTVVDGPVTKIIDGKRFFLDHGDGVGQRPWTFRAIRSIFRNRVCQWLYSAIHPRWTIGFAHSWSSHSRKSGQCKLPPDDIMARPLVEFSKAYDADTAHPHVDFFIYGHLHIAYDKLLPSGARVVILGEWIKEMTYGVWDGKAFKLCRFECI